MDGQVRHVSTAKLRLFPGDGGGFTAGEPLIWANVGFVTRLADQIELVEGRYPHDSAAILNR